jgi:hypothetical protein
VAGYKIGDLVRIRSRAWYEQNKDPVGYVWDPGVSVYLSPRMSKFCGRVMKISRVYIAASGYDLEGVYQADWREWMFEPPENLIENVKDIAL